MSYLLILVSAFAWGSDADAAAIKASVMNYAEGWFQSDPQKMKKALHPNLNKVIVSKMKGSGKEYLETMTAEKLIAVTHHNQKWVEGKSSRDLKIVYQDDRMAVVHLVSDGFYDICNVAKINGEWKIVQVLWAQSPKQAVNSKPSRGRTDPSPFH